MPNTLWISSKFENHTFPLYANPSECHGVFRSLLLFCFGCYFRWQRARQVEHFGRYRHCMALTSGILSVWMCCPYEQCTCSPFAHFTSKTYANIGQSCFCRSLALSILWAMCRRVCARARVCICVCIHARSSNIIKSNKIKYRNATWKSEEARFTHKVDW